MDIKTGEQKTLTTELPYYTITGIWIHDFVDDYMIINVTDNSNGPENIKRWRYVLNLSSATLTEFTLIRPPRGGVFVGFVFVYGQSPTHFVVADREVPRKTLHTDEMGIPYEGEIMDPIYSFIAKEDYWNSIPNYIPITDTITM